MDPLAATARNLQIFWQYGGNTFLGWSSMYSFEPGSGSAYHQQQPDGKLFFRSYDGSLVKEDVRGFEGLGKALSETNDLYACAASRYLEFFTGLAVELADAGDPSFPTESLGDRYYRTLVIKLGMKLKETQSLKELMRAIWTSGLFQKPGMRDALKVD
jgi:hypothetical protein